MPPKEPTIASEKSVNAVAAGAKPSSQAYTHALIIAMESTIATGPRGS